MSRLSLTFACCRYDRMEAIREGAFPIEGIDLNCITLRSGREVFDRMVGGQEFDVAELSASEFISLTGRGDCPFVALPVFPSRVFRHGYIFINTRRGIRRQRRSCQRRRCFRTSRSCSHRCSCWSRSRRSACRCSC